tara:strand:+ start:48 stop:878 length:831 start_codon:yes stop_codon:yes gene_type:complete
VKKTITLLASLLMFIQLSFSQVGTFSVGQTVSDFTVTDVHGNTHTLSSITASGQWVLIDFFFYTCPLCQSTVPFFSELHQKYGCNEGDLFCISIATGDSDAQVLAFENQYSISSGHSPAPAASGNEGGGDAVIASFLPAGYPTYCLVGPDMKLKNADIWPVTGIGDFETAMSSAGFSPNVMNCSGISSLNESSLNKSEIFPNPSSGNIAISVNSKNGNSARIEISNILGQVVYTSENDLVEGDNNIKLNLSSLNAGQYIVRISDENTSMTSSIQIK